MSAAVCILPTTVLKTAEHLFQAAPAGAAPSHASSNSRPARPTMCRGDPLVDAVWRQIWRQKRMAWVSPLPRAAQISDLVARTGKRQAMDHSALPGADAYRLSVARRA